MHLLDHLQHKISQRRENEYSGVYNETLNILRYIKLQNFLRKPQLQALETYIFLKEICRNRPLADVYMDSVDHKTLRKELCNADEINEMIDATDTEKLQIIRNRLEKLLWNDDYTDQVYALTMWTGKTVLMSVFMLYDMVLSHFHPDIEYFASNFLVFAPDTTIIQSLKEIKDFDCINAIPPEYHNILLQIKYHYLEDTKQKLCLSEWSNFNVIITNSQKIIIKTRKGNSENLKKSLLWDLRERQEHEVENQRLLALKRLCKLSIFVDEAHHSFGKTLEWELKKVKETINRIHENKPLVNCVNMTGTPYIEWKMIEKTVFYYGLKQWIEDWILKQVDIMEFGEVKDTEFLKLVMKEFWEQCGDYEVEWKKAKIAIYTWSINELHEVRKTLEQDILRSLHIPSNCIVENHQDADKENKKEFDILDMPQSDKRIILLVNKWTEGRNCKSLFATALYRRPPAIFTLQSTTRCLRAVGDNTKRAMIFLSKENYAMLDKEMQQNFWVTIWDLQNIQKKTQSITCTVQKRKEIVITKVIKSIVSSKQSDYTAITINDSNYKKKEVYMHKKWTVLENGEILFLEQQKDTQSIGASIINDTKNRYEILWHIYSHTHIDFDWIKSILKSNRLEWKAIVDKVSNDNNYLSFIIDEICKNYYAYQEEVTTKQETLQIIRKEIWSFQFEVDTHKLEHKPKLIVYQQDNSREKGNRLWFHLNPYNFDSSDELDLFEHIRSKLKEDEQIKDIYFTWSQTEKQSDFFFEYTIFEDNKVRISKYFPDILVEIQTTDNKKKYLVLEVKGSDKKNDYEQAKRVYKQWDIKVVNEVFAKEIGFSEFTKHNKDFEYRLIFDAKIPSKQAEVVQQIQELEKI